MSPEHVSYSDIVSYADGSLPAADRPAVEAYLRRHPEAARTAALWQAAREAVEGDDSVAPPEALTERVKQMFASRRPAESGPALVDRITEVIAALVYDSRTRAALAGYRGAATAFQLTYEHAGISVDLQAEPGESSSQWRIMGQVSADSPAGIEIAIHRHGEPAVHARCRADDHGVFSCELPSGRFDLRISLGDEVIVLTDVNLS